MDGICYRMVERCAPKRTLGNVLLELHCQTCMSFVGDDSKAGINSLGESCVVLCHQHPGVYQFANVAYPACDL